ncbi:MAG: metallophosphoesterase [Proteobacteria bacterium]|nr:metallophosphoesterase [Pseudomonadota bacterium]
MGKNTLLGAKALLEQSAAADEVRRLREQLRSSEESNSKLAAALERAHATPRAKAPVPAKSARSSGEELVRVVIPDTHGCKADQQALSACLGDVKSLNPDEIVLLGDHVDCGGLLAQHHVLGYVAETSYTYEQDIAATRAFLDALQTAAPRARIHYIEGNHERRVETWCVTQSLRNAKDAEFLRRAFAPEFLLNLKERGIPYYRQGEFYMGLKLPGAIRLGKCYFTHGSRTPRQATDSMLQAFGARLSSAIPTAPSPRPAGPSTREPSPHGIRDASASFSRSGKIPIPSDGAMALACRSSPAQASSST